MNIRIFMLGTGAAMPINRGLPCIALRVDSDIYLFDTGEGCQYRLFRAGLGVVKVKAIFITHLHGDHYLGLFGMFQSMHLSNRRNELYIIAPEKLGNILKTYIDQGLIRVGYPLYFVKIKPWSKMYSDSKVSVEAFPVDHGVEAYGFLISIGNKTIIYTGDTKPMDKLVEIAKGSNILIHEATFTSDMRSEALEEGHSTAADAALIASQAGVRELVLTHISSRYRISEPLFYDAYRFFRRVIVAKDYMIIYM